MPTRPARTPRLPPEERRQQLLDAALDVLSREGFEAVTVEAVAKRAGVTRPVIYDQFGDLDGLLLALIDREERTALTPLLAIVGEAPTDADPDAFLVEAVQRFLEAVRAAPRTWRLILMPPDGGSQELRERVQASRRIVAERVTDLVAWGLEHRGGPAGADVEVLGRLLVAAGEDAARLLVAHPRRYRPDQMAQATRALVALIPREVTLPGEPPFVRPAWWQAPEPWTPEPPTAGRMPMARRRRQLLGHALALLAEEGFEALNIEAVARRAGVSRVVVYRAYGGLQGLVLALLRQASVRIRSQLQELVPADPGDLTPQELLAGALTGFLELVVGDPLTWRVALQRPENAPKALQRMVARRRAGFAEQLRPLVAWGVEGLDLPEGSSPADRMDVDLLARLLLSVGEELGRLALTEPDRFPVERLVRAITAFLAVLPWRAPATT